MNWILVWVAVQIITPDSLDTRDYTVDHRVIGVYDNMVECFQRRESLMNSLEEHPASTQAVCVQIKEN